MRASLFLPFSLSCFVSPTEPGFSAIILMEKASAIPVACLAPPQGCTLIDACAAPGNKTSACAILMRNEGKVFAFDADARRASGLRRTVERRGLSCIEAACCDFLKVRTTSSTGMSSAS